MSDYRSDQRKRRDRRLPWRVDLIRKIAGSLNLKVEKLTDYQYRITNPGNQKSIDIYPIHYKYFDVTTKKRGQVKGDKGLKQLIIEKIVKDKRDASTRTGNS